MASNWDMTPLANFQETEELPDWDDVNWEQPIATGTKKQQQQQQQQQEREWKTGASNYVRPQQALQKLQKLQKPQKRESKKREVRSDKDDLIRLKNVCVADRSFTNGGLNLEDMTALAKDLDIGNGTRAEVRVALCRKFYPAVLVKETTLGGSDNVKDPQTKKKSKKYKNILPSDDDIKQRMKRYCAFNNTYNDGGWNQDQAIEIASWFGIPNADKMTREDLRNRLCNAYNKYTSKVYIPSLHDDTSSAAVTFRYDTDALPLITEFAAELVGTLSETLPEMHASNGMAYFYSFKKTDKLGRYPVIGLFQGPSDVKGNPAPRALPNQKTMIDYLHQSVPNVYVNAETNEISTTQQEGFVEIPVDFAILEEKGHVNVYAIWNIIRWAWYAKKTVEQRAKILLDRAYARPE
jgi:hypothetical protein